MVPTETKVLLTVTEVPTGMFCTMPLGCAKSAYQDLEKNGYRGLMQAARISCFEESNYFSGLALVLPPDAKMGLGTCGCGASIWGPSDISETCRMGTMPRAAWLLANPPPNSHIVYPYADDQHMVDAVGFFTASGLRDEGAVILITTAAHRDAIRKYLRSDGNVDPFEASGQLTFLDAGDTMDNILAGGNPECRLFQEAIGTRIDHARCDRKGRIREVRLFGEMVNLLWPKNREAAERVEGLGNEVAAEYSIPVLCAYALDGLGQSHLPDSLINLHSHSVVW